MVRGPAAPFWRRLWGWLQVVRPGIWLATGSEQEAKTRNQLQRLLQGYDLRRWRFTHRIRIDQNTVIPHSHPVLTLDTRHLDDDRLLLATYLHEQLHWFVRKRRQAKAALQELRQRYPTVPVARPEGAGDEFSTYLHYLVCYLEYAALIDVLGSEEARRAIDFWCTHHYTEIYKTVLRDFDGIGEIVSRYGLIP